MVKDREMAKPSPTHNGAPELIAFGNSIRKARLDLDLSQEGLANLIGIDRSYMGGIERGEHNIALINIVRIAEALEIKASDLLRDAKL